MKTAPAVFLGLQETLPGRPPIELYNLTEAVGPIPVDSTVSRQTLEKLGFFVPPIPADFQQPSTDLP